jgi:transcriptional regulator with XRE-family HTH domain
VAQDEWSRSVASTIAEQVRRTRNRKELSAQELSDRCAQLGFPIHRSVIANLENGRRPTVGVDELLVLAKALAVPALWLLFPPDAERVEQLPGRFTDPLTASQEFTGLGPAEMELYVEHDAEMRNLWALLRKSLNRGGWIMDGSELRMARNSYRSLARLRQQIASRGLAEPPLPPELFDLIGKAGFANGEAHSSAQQGSHDDHGT